MANETEQDEMTIDEMIKGEKLQQILEAALLAAGQPLSLVKLAGLFGDLADTQAFVLLQ